MAHGNKYPRAQEPGITSVASEIKIRTLGSGGSQTQKANPHFVDVGKWWMPG